MKYAFFLLLSGLSLVACKSTDVTPVDGGNQIAGIYPLTYVRGDSAGVKLYEYALPYVVGTNSITGTITARRDSAAVLFLTQLIRVTGYADQTAIIGTVRLKTISAGSYDLYQNNVKIGTADGTNLNLDEQQTDPATGTVYRTILTSRK